MNHRIGLALAVVVLAAACGGEETPATAPSPAPTSPPTSAAPATTATTTLAPAADAPLLGGTDWVVTEYVLPAGGLTNVWPDTEITLQFGDDGSVSGSGGCNDYQGTYQVEGPYDEFVDGVRDPNDGQAIRIDSLTQSAVRCEPDRVMTQEEEYLANLSGVGRWVVVRSNLSLRTADGFSLINAEPAA